MSGAAPKLPDDMVRKSLGEAVQCEGLFLEVQRATLESLAQEVLDRRTADGLNQETINEQRKEIADMRFRLHMMASKIDNAEQLARDLQTTLKLQAEEMQYLREARRLAVVK